MSRPPRPSALALKARYERERALSSRLVQLGALGSDRLLLELVDVVVVQGAVVDERRLREELEAAERWVAAGCPLPATPSPGSTGSTGSTGETREATDDARHERG